MVELKKYEVEVNGVGTSLWLNARDAEMWGVGDAHEKNAAAAGHAGMEKKRVENKARKPRNKAATSGDE